MDLHELAGALERDPRLVATRAAELAERAKAAGDHRTASAALAVLGRAYRLLEEIALAERALRDAIAIAEAAALDELAADAHLGIAGVLSMSGNTTDGFAHLRRAEALGNDRIRTFAWLQRAVLSQRVGLVAEALADYERALPALEQQGATLDVVRVLANRGVILLGAGRAAEAAADFERAAAGFEAAGNAFAAAQVRHNLGWAAARLGDLPRALGIFDDVERRFAELGHDATQAQVERAEVLLAAGLSSDAAALATAATERLAAAGNLSVAAEALLLCARALRLEGRLAEAVAQADRARTLFISQRSPGWERSAHVEVLTGRAALGDLPAPEPIEELASALAAAGDVWGELEALALACRAAGSRGDHDRAARLADAAAARAGGIGLAPLRLLATEARMVAAELRGDRGAAQRAAAAGIGEVDRHRASLGATDARASVARLSSSFASTGLRLAAQTGRATSVLAWMERARARALEHPPARPPDDAAVAAALAELRAVTAELRAEETGGGDLTGLQRRLAALERSVRRSHERTAGATTAPSRAEQAPSFDVAALRDQLADRVLLSLAEIDGDLVGVVVDRRRARLVRLGSAEAVQRAGASATDALRTLARPALNEARRASATERLRRALDALSQQVIEPARLPDGDVVLLAPGTLHATPWRMVRALAGRAVTMAPSAAWWTRSARDQEASSARSSTALAVAGPRLVEAEAEAATVAQRYPQRTLLAGAAASAAAVLAALEGVGLAHVAAHAQFRHDNPLWSAIELADGPLTVYDLQRLTRAPRVVVLSTCESAASGARSGDELLGLAGALLAGGTRSLVASIGPLPDTPTTRLAMVRLHDALAAGDSVAAALARATWPGGGVADPRADPVGEPDQAALACLTCLGYGFDRR